MLFVVRRLLALGVGVPVGVLDAEGASCAKPLEADTVRTTPELVYDRSEVKRRVTAGPEEVSVKASTAPL